MSYGEYLKENKKAALAVRKMKLIFELGYMDYHRFRPKKGEKK